MQVVEACTYVAKYAGVVVTDATEKSRVLPILTTRQDIYTDPQKPVAVEPKADRVKAWRPVTDLYKLEGVGHWPSIEAPAVISDAILHRLPTE